MKPFVITAMLVTLAASVSAQPAPVQSAEAALKQRAAEWVLIWTTHDPQRLAGFWTVDGDLINPFGQVANGHDEIEKLMREEQAGRLKDSTYELKVDSVHLVKPDVAVVDWTGVMHNMRGADGKMLPSQQHHVTVVCVKQDGQWMFASARPGPFSAQAGNAAASAQ